MTFKAKRERMAEVNDKALLADGFEEALIGWAERCGQPSLAVYSYARCVLILMKRDGLKHDEAVEYIEFNVTGAWMGENTPLFIHLFSPLD